MKLVLKLIVLVLTASAVAGFVVRPCTVCPSRNPSALAATVDAESGSRTRRGFVTAAVTLGVGAVATLGNNVLPAVAETMDDLAMPTEKEQAAMDVSTLVISCVHTLVLFGGTSFPRVCYKAWPFRHGICTYSASMYISFSRRAYITIPSLDSANVPSFPHDESEGYQQVIVAGEDQMHGLLRPFFPAA